MSKICPTLIFGFYAKNGTFRVLKDRFWKTLEESHFVPSGGLRLSILKKVKFLIKLDIKILSRRLLDDPLGTSYMKFERLDPGH